MQKKKIVVIGGGNGSAICLEGLKKYADKFDISAVISMSDSGGSSGRLRKEFKTLPPGDIMRAILSLSKYDYQELRRVFYWPRFKNCGKLDSHNVGNLFLTLAAKYCGNFLYALDALSYSVQALGKVYPVTLRSVDLVAQLDNGKIVRTEEFIDVPQYNRGWKIKKVWLEPNCKAYSEAMKSISSADLIILAPGSLYTSLVATLLPKGIKDTIAENKKAKLIYVAGSAYRLDGETGPEKLSDVISQLGHYLPRKIDLVIHNSHELTRKQKEVYKGRNWGVLTFDKRNTKEFNVKSVKFENKEGGLDAKMLGVILRKLC